MECQKATVFNSDPIWKKTWPAQLKRCVRIVLGNMSSYITTIDKHFSNNRDLKRFWLFWKAIFLESVLTFLSSQAYKAKTPEHSVKLQPSHHTNLSLVWCRKNEEAHYRELNQLLQLLISKWFRFSSAVHFNILNSKQQCSYTKIGFVFEKGRHKIKCH